jgi:hypothetical protein
VGNRWQQFRDALSDAMPGLPETLVIVAVIIGLLWLTLLVRAWFRDDSGRTGQTGDLLTEMRELHREGGLTEDEFRLIKSRLVSAAAGGPGSLRQKTAPYEAPGSDKTVAGSPGATAQSAPSLHGRSDQPGQEASGLPDGQS